MKNITRSLFWIFISIGLLTGFRFFPKGNNWDIDNSSAARSKLFVVYPYPTKTLKNNFPADDSLAGTDTVTVQQAMNAIFADYNNIQGAFVTLVDTSDSDYSSSTADGRTITIENKNPQALGAGGETSQKYEKGKIVGCTISLKDSMYDSAKGYTGVVTHELGHCLGLDHPQDTVHAVMSYFHSGDVYRLQADDKMGIIYLYPVDSSLSKEDATLGMACSRR